MSEKEKTYKRLSHTENDMSDYCKAKQRIYHDKPVPPIYGTIATDLARDNLENDITAADLQDL